MPGPAGGGYPCRGVPQLGPAGDTPGGYPTSSTPVRPGPGYPCQGVGRYPCQGTWTWPGGVTPVRGVLHLRYPLSDMAKGVPLLWVPPPVRPGQGVPLPGRGGGGTPPRVEYLIRRGRYASCVHAGGLSCYVNDLKNDPNKALH